MLSFGKFTDFSVEWYAKVGYIYLFLMWICSWTPLIESATEWLLKWIARRQDTKRTMDPLNSQTKQK